MRLSSKVIQSHHTDGREPNEELSQRFGLIKAPVSIAAAGYELHVLALELPQLSK